MKALKMMCLVLVFTYMTSVSCKAQGVTLINENFAFYVGTDQHVHEFYNSKANGYAWSTSDLCARAGAPSVASGSGLVTLNWSGIVQVFYVSTDKHVHELYGNTSNSTWSTQDVSSLSGAALALTNSALTTTGLGSTEHIFYVGTDQHVHEVNSVSNTSWATSDDTALSGAPAVASSGPLTAMPFSSGMTVFFFGSDQHIHEIFKNSAGAWSTTDVTSTVSAPLPVSGSSLVAWVNNSELFIFFVSSVDHLYLIANNGSWGKEDLTTSIPTPNATPQAGLAAQSGISSLAGYLFAYYTNSSSQIYDLPFRYSWQTPYNLTSLSGGTAPTPSSPLVAYLGDAYYNVFYVSGQYVYTLQGTSPVGGTWTYLDLTATTGATSAVAGTPLVGLSAN